MTPTEHYAEAERLLGEVLGRFGQMDALKGRLMSDPNARFEILEAASAIRELVPVAQVHATLATINADYTWPQRYIVNTEDLHDDLISRAGLTKTAVQAWLDTPDGKKFLADLAPTALPDGGGAYRVPSAADDADSWRILEEWMATHCQTAAQAENLVGWLKENADEGEWITWRPVGGFSRETVRPFNLGTE